MSSRFVFVLVCGIISLIAAIMNYRESINATFYDYWMFIAAILILACAAMLYKPQKQ